MQSLKNEKLLNTEFTECHGVGHGANNSIQTSFLSISYSSVTLYKPGATPWLNYLPYI
jgi:hypothetical protein